MFGRKSISTSRGRTWEWLHSLWILWTFTFGFFSWVAFAYIGIRVRHPRWTLWAALYASPFAVFAILSSVAEQRWLDLTLSIAIIFGFVAVVHAFLVRREYLLRLDLIKRETSHVSRTSMGRSWELLHSLWIAWTFALGLTSWIAFFYIGLRSGRRRWLLWGAIYLATALPFFVSPNNQTGQFTVGIMVVAGVFSVVHAFAIREDYLVRLERREDEESKAEAQTLRGFEAEYQRQISTKTQDSSPVEDRTNSAPESVTGHAPDETRASHEEALAKDHLESKHSEPANVPPAVPADSVPVSQTNSEPGAQSEIIGLPSLRHMSETYPLPLAYSWSLLQGIWDTRDRYREQLRHAENMLAFLGSVSLALLAENDYEKAQLDLTIPWQGGISFGAWKLIIQRCDKAFRTYEDNPLAEDIRQLKIGSEKKGFGADIAALISTRNDFHHGRGPQTEDDVAAVSNDAQMRIERCMEALDFFTRYPIRLVQDFDVDRRRGDFALKCLRLEGDGPGFLQEKVSFPKALPRGDLVMDIGVADWTQLYPFIIASNCPRCRYRETYFIDRWNDRKGTAVMKSFERGHVEERADISDSLGSLTKNAE